MKFIPTWTSHTSGRCNSSAASCVHFRPRTVCWRRRAAASWPQSPSFACDPSAAAPRPSCQWCRSRLGPRWPGSCSGSTASCLQSARRKRGDIVGVFDCLTQAWRWKRAGSSATVEWNTVRWICKQILPSTVHPLKRLGTFYGGCSSELLQCISCHNYMQKEKAVMGNQKL